MKVYFDGQCMVCSREIEHYARVSHTAPIEYIDIFDPTFDAKNEGLDQIKVHQELHVKCDDGRILTGVDSFLEMWKVMGKYSFLSATLKHPFIRPLANCGYWIFAYHIRPHLPKRKSPICLIPKPAKKEQV